MGVVERLECIRRELGMGDEFWELTLGQVATLRHRAVVGAKWTRGEI